MSSRVLIKNNGFATELEKYVGAKIDGDPLWCARFNATDPEAVIKTYIDYLNESADIIVTNTYQASVEGYMEHLGLSKEESIELIKESVQLAHIARNKFLKSKGKTLQETNGLPMIVASIGPYGAHLHDGSEYTGNYADSVDPEIMKKWHKIRIDAILEAGVDALAIETIPCKVEAKALIELLCDDFPHVKFWFSTQCKNDKTLAHGEPFSEVCEMIWNELKSRNLTENCYGIGVNCINPKFVTPLFESVNGDRKPEDRIPLVVYPNSGETYEEGVGWVRKGNILPIESYIPEWVELGVKILGGCCRTYAKDMPKYKKVLASLSK